MSKIKLKRLEQLIKQVMCKRLGVYCVLYECHVKERYSHKKGLRLSVLMAPVADYPRYRFCVPYPERPEELVAHFDHILHELEIYQPQWGGGQAMRDFLNGRLGTSLLSGLGYLDKQLASGMIGNHSGVKFYASTPPKYIGRLPGVSVSPRYFIPKP